MKKSSVKSDETTTVLELKARAFKFVEERDWKKYHNTKNLTMSIAIEAGELMELYQWVSDKEMNAVSKDANISGKLREELADIACGDVWGRTDLQEVGIKEKVGHTEIFLRSEKGEKYFEAAVEAGYVQKLPGSPPDYPMEKHYVINPGWFKRVGSLARIRHRAKYGWPLPRIE